MASKLSTREVANRLGLEPKEVIRRIRRGDIVAEKFGWIWTVNESEVEKVKNKDWYKRYQNRHAVTS